MTVFSSSPSSRPRRIRILSLLLACAVGTPGVVCAQDNAPPRELEERTATDLDKLQPLLDAKNWDGALALIQGIRKRVDAKSYDMAIATDVEAKLYLQKGDYAKAIDPWEIALKLGDAYKFFDHNSQQERVYYLAQICYQEATGTKGAQQKQYFAKAISYLERWLADSQKPPLDPARAEASMFFANVLYQQAVIDPEKVDMALVKRAGEQIELALRSSIRPKESSYLILLAVAQQEGNWVRLGEILELLVKQYPGKKDYWSQLVGVYGTLAAQEKIDAATAREYNTRAIIAMERAQALGFMKTPKDNYSLFGMYFNVGQFGRATEVLHAGLRDGSIESEQKNWELLASSYQQVDKPYAAIEALMEGAKKFPKSGQLDYQAATIYYALNKPEDAYKQMKNALQKGGLEKPGTAHGFMAYVSWEIGNLNEALEAVEKALTFPDAQKDTQLPRLKGAIEEALRERETAATVASTR